MQFRIVLHVENAVVRVGSGDAPDMPPLAARLQRLRIGLFLRNDLRRLRRGQVAGNVHIHPYVEKHDSILNRC
ncbi:hypothetical protein D3C72_2357170 [compost metagenome]